VAIPHFSSPLRRSNEQVGLFLAFIVKVVAFAFALISGVFMIGVLFSFAIWVLTGQHAAFLSMLDFLGLRWVRFWRTDAKIGHSSGGSVWPVAVRQLTESRAGKAAIPLPIMLRRITSCSNSHCFTLPATPRIGS
jgi:hypothetical protein